MSDDQGAFHVHFGSGRSIDLDALRSRRSAFMPDNGHSWVISTIFALDDPEQALDLMTLDEKSFVGVSDIYCLLCRETYTSVNRFHKCEQTPSQQ